MAGLSHLLKINTVTSLVILVATIVTWTKTVRYKPTFLVATMLVIKTTRLLNGWVGIGNLELFNKPMPQTDSKDPTLMVVDLVTDPELGSLVPHRPHHQEIPLSRNKWTKLWRLSRKASISAYPLSHRMLAKEARPVANQMIHFSRYQLNTKMFIPLIRRINEFKMGFGKLTISKKSLMIK